MVYDAAGNLLGSCRLCSRKILNCQLRRTHLHQNNFDDNLVQSADRTCVVSASNRTLVTSGRAPSVAREIASAGAFPPVPVRVITGGLTPKSSLMSPGALGAKRANQQDLARLSPQGEHVIAHKSGHFPQLTEPELVLDVLADLLRSCGGRGA